MIQAVREKIESIASKVLDTECHSFNLNGNMFLKIEVRGNIMLCKLFEGDPVNRDSFEYEFDDIDINEIEFSKGHDFLPIVQEEVVRKHSHIRFVFEYEKDIGSSADIDVLTIAPVASFRFARALVLERNY